jgi:uncharacterized protein
MITILSLVWDAWNIAHIARHDVTPDEVEEVCTADPVIRATYSNRFLAIGETKSGRILAVVLDPEPEDGVFYVVTARSADRKERRIYEAEKGGEQAA